MEEDLLDALQYTYYNTRVPLEWQEDFGELNWLGPCCSKVVLGYGGKVYECKYNIDPVKPHGFGIKECSIIIEDYIIHDRIGGCLVRTMTDESVRAYMFKMVISILTDEFLKEHKECYYE